VTSTGFKSESDGGRSFLLVADNHVDQTTRTVPETQKSRVCKILQSFLKNGPDVPHFF